jgi:hypothetical protein
MSRRTRDRRGCLAQITGNLWPDTCFLARVLSETEIQRGGPARSLKTSTTGLGRTFSLVNLHWRAWTERARTMASGSSELI